jgi:hypothetical protein
MDAVNTSYAEYKREQQARTDAQAASAQECAQASGITEAQAEHIIAITSELGTLMTRKYVQGVKKYGGNLWERSEEYLLQEAINEAIDQVVYLLTLKQKRATRKALENASDESRDDRCW